MLALPLQVVDNFLLQYNVGQVLFFVFVLATLAVLPLRSPRLLGLQTALFGFIFVVTPQSLLQAVHWKFVGIALLFVGPMLVISSRR